MKKTMILAVCLLTLLSFTVLTTVPEVVAQAFKQKYPDVKKVKWDKEHNNEFEASFILNKKEVSIVYTLDGSIKEIETEIPVSELPQIVKEALLKKYPNTRINEASRIERADKSIVFETELRLNKKKTDLLFDENGIEVK